MKTVTIAVIGDFDKKKPSHVATNKALEISAQNLSIPIKVNWLATKSVENRNQLELLNNYNGIWGAPGIPESSLGLVNGIKVAREKHIPYLGT